MKAFVLLLPVLILSACAHHKDVRPGADGVHRVVVRGAEASGVERKAIDEANHFCKQFGQIAYVVNEEKTQYTGSMDENTRKTIKKASTAAMVIGAGVGHGRNTGAGQVLGGAGTAGWIMTSGDDYVADMKFKCQ